MYTNILVDTRKSRRKGLYSFYQQTLAN